MPVREDQTCAGRDLFGQAVEQRQHPRAGFGFRRLRLLPADVVQALVDGDRALLYVHIFPGQRQQLAVTQAGIHRPVGEHAERQIRVFLNAPDILGGRHFDLPLRQALRNADFARDVCIQVSVVNAPAEDQTDNAELVPCRLFRGVRLFAERLYEAAHVNRPELLRIRGAEVSGGAPHGSLVALRGVRGERRFGLFPPAVCQRLEGHAALPAGGLRVVTYEIGRASCRERV